MSTPFHFEKIVTAALPITQNVVWLDEVIEGWHLVAFPQAPGLFLVSHKPASPRELAVALALCQVENFASMSHAMAGERTGVLQ
jgi:hypothetical protein